MTLPKQLDQMRDEYSSDKTQFCHCAGPTCSGCEPIVAKLTCDAFDVGASAVLEKAQELVDVLKNYTIDRKIAHDFPGTGLNYAEHNNKFLKALESWQSFIEGNDK